MLPARNRLKSRREFNRLYRRGERKSCGNILMIYARDEGKDVKVGFSVGVKFSKKAATRNLIKRWMREAVREFLPMIKPGLNIIFIIDSQSSLQSLSFFSVKDDISGLIKKSKLV